MRLKKETMRNILIRLDSYINTPIKDSEVAYHIDLMIDGDMIKGKRIRDGSESYYLSLQLTEKGFDLLAHISNKQVWDAIEQRLSDNDMTVNDVPIDIIKWLSQDIMKGMFGC